MPRSRVPSYLRQLPGISPLPVQHCICRIIAYEFLFCRIPPQFPSEFEGDVGQVAKGGDAVADVHWEIRVLSAFDAQQEIVVLSFWVCVEVDFFRTNYRFQ